jgi:hypothetical protein
MNSSIIEQIIEQINDLPDNLQQEVLTFAVTLRKSYLQNSDSNAWDVLESLTGTVEAPADWSKEHDHYFYGRYK